MGRRRKTKITLEVWEALKKGQAYIDEFGLRKLLWVSDAYVDFDTGTPNNQPYDKLLSECIILFEHKLFNDKFLKIVNISPKHVTPHVINVNEMGDAQLMEMIRKANTFMRKLEADGYLVRGVERESMEGFPNY